jgi:hypothetical protein
VYREKQLSHLGGNFIQAHEFKSPLEELKKDNKKK